MVLTRLLIKYQMTQHKKNSHKHCQRLPVGRALPAQHHYYHYMTWWLFIPIKMCTLRQTCIWFEVHPLFLRVGLGHGGLSHTVQLDRKHTVTLTQRSAIIRLHAMPCTNSLHCVSIRCNTQSGTAASQTLLVPLARVYKDWAFCHVEFCLPYMWEGVFDQGRKAFFLVVVVFFCCRLLRQLEVSWSGAPLGSSRNTHC